jgi:hypothetical protein
MTTSIDELTNLFFGSWQRTSFVGTPFVILASVMGIYNFKTCYGGNVGSLLKTSLRFTTVYMLVFAMIYFITINPDEANNENDVILQAGSASVAITVAMWAVYSLGKTYGASASKSKFGSSSSKTVRQNSFNAPIKRSNTSTSSFGSNRSMTSASDYPIGGTRRQGSIQSIDAPYSRRNTM